MKKLPIGIQTFSEIIKNDYIYIDKTDMALDLIKNYKYAFLSRPRRFGKSLFIDTLQEIFEGNKELFKGLHIYDKWEFEKYPVIKIDWNGKNQSLDDLKVNLKENLLDNQVRLGLECEKDLNEIICFQRLIKSAFEKYEMPVVVLIDEYDKPILDVVEDLDQAKLHREYIKGLYSVLKGLDRYLKFVFLTGVSKFSKASIFSGLNMLSDISLNPKYGNICGYTQNNIENEFKEHLQSVDLEELKQWYNGYNFLGEAVYNPFDILQFIANKFLFRNYWWESGSPSFLIKLLKNNQYTIAQLEDMTVGEELVSSFDIEKIKLEVILFQAGYLTIDKQIQKRHRIEYKLKVPNLEVQISLNNLFIDYLTNRVDYQIQDNIYDSLESADLEFFNQTMKQLFASIPYNNYVKNNISDFEGYYASVFYAYLRGSGLEVIPEDVTNKGRIDITIKIDNKVYILEFKMKDNNNPLQQIKTKKYYEKYNGDIYLVGIEFDEESKNITNVEWEKIKNEL